MRFQEIITERSRSAPLYHYMVYEKAMDVFANDVMPARWQHNIPGMGERLGNSFSRNAKFNFGSNHLIRLIMDQSKLAATHKIVPLDAEIVFRHKGDNLPRLHGFADRKINQRPGSSPMAEEFVIGDIKPLHKYVAAVEILRPNFYYVTGAGAFRLDEAVKTYCEKFNIPLKIDPEWVESLAEIKKRWEDEAAEEADDLDEQVVNEINVIDDLDDRANFDRRDHGVWDEELEQSVKVTSFGEFDLRAYEEHGRTRYFFTDGWGKLVGTALVYHNSYQIVNDLRGNIVTVSYIWLDPEVRSKGLGFDFYRYLIDSGCQILSDVDQTQWARKLWQRLVQTFKVRPVFQNKMGKPVTDIAEFYGEYKSGRLLASKR